MASVIIVTGLPRTGPTYMGLILEQCGATPVTPLQPNPVTGCNLTLGEDPNVWNYCLSLLGADGVFGIPSTTIPGSLNSTIVLAFQSYLAAQLTAAGTSPYLLVCHAAPMIFPTILDAFPNGTTINVILTTRTTANTKASLAAEAGVTTNQATAYINGYTTALTTASSQLTAAGITPVSVNWDTILTASYATLESQIIGLGLTVPNNASSLLAQITAEFGS